mgnify:CR=1 FL=1
MNRSLAILSAGALFAATAAAQTFESNFGTQLLTLADDSVTTTQTMNISFPMGGVFTSYDQCRVNSNGLIMLWNSSAPTFLGSTTTGYSTLPATMVTNLRTIAGNGPRIAPYWRDLDDVNVFVNDTVAGRYTVTWTNCQHWTSGGPIGTPFTMQAQLLSTGEVWFFYDANANQQNIQPIGGISQGNAVAAPSATDLSAGAVGVSTSQIVYESWGAGAFDLADSFVQFTPNGSGGYDHFSGALPAAASHDEFGVGCHDFDIQSPSDSIYEFFADAAVASAALQGNAMTATPTGNGYTFNWIAGGAAGLYVAPSGGATSLLPSDDGNEVVTLPSPFNSNSGPVTDINVSHNGWITLGTVANNAGDFNVTGPEVAAASGEAFYTFSDFRDDNTTPSPSGTIKTEAIGNVFYVTWDGVHHWAAPQVLTPCTFQFQLDLTTGAVTYVWVTIDTNTTSSFGSSYLVGYTGPGASTDPGSVTLSTALPATAVNNVSGNAMTLSASPPPVINPSTLVTWTANDIVEAQPGTDIYLSTVFLSINPVPAGIDLTGMLTSVAGCNLYINSLDLDLGAQVTASPTASWTYTFDNVVFTPGTSVAAQAVALFDPAFPLANGESGGFLFSNGVLSTVELQ